MVPSEMYREVLASLEKEGKKEDAAEPPLELKESNVLQVELLKIRKELSTDSARADWILPRRERIRAIWEGSSRLRKIVRQDVALAAELLDRLLQEEEEKQNKKGVEQGRERRAA